MITILNQTSRFLRITLSRGKVLRLGPRKEGQISTQDADRDSVTQLVADGTIKIKCDVIDRGAMQIELA